MNSLMNTTWNFNAPATEGTIEFVQSGPSGHAGAANINWGQGNSVQGTWAEAADGSGNFTVIYANFGAAGDGSYPPPFGLPTMNSGQLDMTPVVLTGKHANGQANMYCTNTFTACAPSGQLMASFNMSTQ
jgi:hypothetical protein